jgi:hypothetical protein
MSVPGIVFHGFDGRDLCVDTATGRVAGEWIALPDAATNLDYPTPAELCRCCGLELLPSGSKWSVWFCDECKGRVVALNKAAGRCVVPIGRHSMMNQVFDRGRTRDQVTVEGFVVELRDMVGGIQRLSEWAAEVVRRNCESLGLSGNPSVRLSAYLEAVDRVAPPREAAFRTMIEWWRDDT